MIQQYVDMFITAEPEIRARLGEKHRHSYDDLVKLVIETVTDADGWSQPDPERIHTIDDGEYQGVIVFVIACQGYQCDNYWYVTVRYGSCSGCDTLQAINGYTDDPPTPEQVDSYWTLCLHIIQGLTPMQ